VALQSPRSMMTPSVDVVIPTYENWKLTESCLSHLRAQTIHHVAIVADSRPADGTLELVREKFPDVREFLPNQLEGPVGGAAVGDDGDVMNRLGAEMREATLRELPVLVRGDDDVYGGSHH